MSVVLSNFISVPYRGGYVAQSIPFGRVIGEHRRQQSKVITVTLDWYNIYTNNAVNLNFQASSAQTTLEEICMVYVDNTQNYQSVCVFFGDTQYCINVPANTSGYYPVFSANKFCTVYNTLVNTPSTTAANTTVLFCNFEIPGFSSILQPQPAVPVNAPATVLYASTPMMDINHTAVALTANGNYAVTSLNAILVTEQSQSVGYPISAHPWAGYFSCGNIFAAWSINVLACSAATTLGVNILCNNQSYSPPIILPRGNSIYLYVPNWPFGSNIYMTFLVTITGFSLP